MFLAEETDRGSPVVQQLADEVFDGEVDVGHNVAVAFGAHVGRPMVQHMVHGKVDRVLGRWPSTTEVRHG